MTKSNIRVLFIGSLIACLSACGGANEDAKPAKIEGGSQVVNIYNWPDYIAEDTIRNFESKTGIKVNYQVYSSNDAMMAQLALTPDSFDLIFPNAQPYAKQLIERGEVQPLDKKQLSNSQHMDKAIMAEIAQVDPGNAHVIPYMWGTTGIGINVRKVKALLGQDVPLDSWSLLFDPENARKLSRCGIGIIDDNHEVFSAMLMWMGKSPNDYSEEATNAVKNAYAAIRPQVRSITDSSQLIDAMANGDICIALLYSGDVAQAKQKAIDAQSPDAAALRYVIPREGALRWIDVAAIPKKAKNAGNAHVFLQYLMEPKTIADITNTVSYANANTSSTSMIDPSIAKDPGIYPPADVVAKLRTPQQPSEEESTRRKSAWELMINGL